MIHCIAHHVGQRIGQGLEQALVQSHVLAPDIELNFLVEACGQVADQTGELAEHIANGLEPGLHHNVLQLGGDLVDTLIGGLQSPWIILRNRGAQLVAPQHQLACQIHQHLKRSHVDPDAVFHYRCGRCGRRTVIGRLCR